MPDDVISKATGELSLDAVNPKWSSLQSQKVAVHRVYVARDIWNIVYQW